MLTQTDLNAIGRLIDKKLIPIDEKLSKTVTKEDSKRFATKDDLKKFATKRDLKTTENRIIKRINFATDYFDEKIIDHEMRIKNLETNYSVSVT
jgi:hypothetical protein